MCVAVTELRNVREVSRCILRTEQTLVLVRPTLEASAVGAACH